MRYLGLDLGTKTLGVSITDKIGLITRELPVIRFDFEDYDSALIQAKEVIDEYNIKMEQQNKEKYKRIFYIIEVDDYNRDYDYQYIDDQIMYIIQVGRDVGIYVVFISRNVNKITSIMFSLFKYKLLFNIGKATSKLVEYKHLEVLSNKGECLFYRDNIIKRIQTPKLSLDEIKKIEKNI